MEKYFQNFHKHSSFSHRYNKDSPLTYKDYFKYYKEYADKGIPTIYSTVEHGWQSPYFRVYDDLEKFNKKNLEKNPNYKPIKFIFGTEAYWVKDRFEKDSSNCHIVLLAKNDNGRKKINRAIYESFNTGYYYKNRMDLDILLSLPKDDVMCTTACIQFWNKYDIDELDEIVLKLNEHFTSFYLEVQNHNTESQKKLNQHILELHYKYNIPIIVGIDSHILYPDQEDDRNDLLKSNSIQYEDEDGWYMDLPTYDVIVERFKEQGVLSDEEIYEALENTNVILDFEDIVLDRSLKVPVAKQYRGLSQEERNQVFENIIIDEWYKQYSDINEDKYDEYIKEVKHDIAEIEACNMADYFIDSYEIMKRGQEVYGGVLTPSGRGSAVSMFLNKLLRLTKVDKVNSPVLMYSERFLTKERVLDSHTPPDIDNNVSDREPFIKAQKDIVGENGTFDLIALGTLHYKSAFKMYSRAYELDPQIANEVTKQISKYELDLKHADDDEKDLIDIYDYVDKEKYGNLIEGCQQYMGIVDTLKPHPCATIAYSGDVVEDIGIIMVRPESQGDKAKQTFVAVIESGTIDSFGYLKQDYLIVDSIGLTYDIYKEIGIEPLSVNELLKTIENDKETWDIYTNGYTMCVNQCEQKKSTEKVMRYKPKNIAELCMFISGIRPSFQSMYKVFEQRQHFDYGIKAFDNLIQDKYCDSSFILYQEHLMKVLGFAGFPMSETYTIIKAISKKKDYIIKGAKEKFIPNFAQAIINTKETDDINKATEMAEKVWRVVEDSAAYGFNCVSGDTIIVKGNKNNHKPLTVEEMWLTLNDKEWAEKNGHSSLHDKYKKYGYGKALSLKNDKLFLNTIIDITRQPKAQLYEITTESGKKIKATENHKFPTKSGIKFLKDLKINDELYIMGKYEKTNKKYTLTNGNFESNVPQKGQCGFQSKPNGNSVIYDNFRTIKTRERCVCEDCGKFVKRFEIHHIDFDRTNNCFENYAWLCPSCHKKRHYQNGRTKMYEKGISTYFEKIISIEKKEFDYVYDVTMSEDIGHNFVANDGIITCNSAHAYCMAIDSVTLAWLKAHYPLEFYKVALQRYTRKGEKDKVSSLKAEMLKRGYKLKPIKFGDDNRDFMIDKENNCITQTMSSIKNMQKIAPDILYEIGLHKNDFPNLFYVFNEINKTKLNKKSIDILIKMNYFSDYGDINYVLYQLKIYEDTKEILNKFSDCKQLKKKDCELYEFPVEEISKFAGKETEKLFKDIDSDKLYNYILDNYEKIVELVSKRYFYKPTEKIEEMAYEIGLGGYTNLIDETLSDKLYIISDEEKNQYGTVFLTLYQCCSGHTYNYKVNRKAYQERPCGVGDILKCAIRDQFKRIKNEDGDWVESNETETILKDYTIIKKLEDNLNEE